VGACGSEKVKVKKFSLVRKAGKERMIRMDRMKGDEQDGGLGRGEQYLEAVLKPHPPSPSPKTGEGELVTFSRWAKIPQAIIP
jgi:hypothetical protein